MLEIRIEFCENRNVQGTLTVVDPNQNIVFGPVAVSGLASTLDAYHNGNPTRDSLLPFGHTPTGVFMVEDISSMEGISLEGIEDFGRFGLVALKAIGGDALEAYRLNGRTICIHGGLNSGDRLLSATNGSIRLFSSDLRELLTVLRSDPDGPRSITCVCSESKEEVSVSRHVDAPSRIGENWRQRFQAVLTKVGAVSLSSFAVPQVLAQELGGGGGGCCIGGPTDPSPEAMSLPPATISEQHILTQEGGNTLIAYVPDSRSGVTVAGGIDLSRYSKKDFVEMGFDGAQVHRLEPYLSGSTSKPLKGKAAAKVLALKPLVLHPTEAKILNHRVYKWHARTVARHFYEAVKKGGSSGGLTFAALPRQWRTVMTSMQLVDPKFPFSKVFKATVSCDLEEAISSLKNYQHHNASINQRAFQNAAYLLKTKATLPTRANNK